MKNSGRRFFKFGRSGFTLVEIMIVVVIIAVLASLAIPAFRNARNRALRTAMQNNLRQIVGAAHQFMADNNTAQATIANIIQINEADGTADNAPGATDTGFVNAITKVLDEDYVNATPSGGGTNTAGIVFADTTGLSVSTLDGSITASITF